MRDGERAEIDADELVVDDVVLLADGDRISADLALESRRTRSRSTRPTLTGESVPVTRLW